jgi:hypothetical protein
MKTSTTNQQASTEYLPYRGQRKQRHLSINSNSKITKSKELYLRFQELQFRKMQIPQLWMSALKKLRLHWVFKE